MGYRMGGMSEYSQSLLDASIAHAHHSARPQQQFRVPSCVCNDVNRHVCGIGSMKSRP
jgi:hypothetical protein